MLAMGRILGFLFLFNVSTTVQAAWVGEVELGLGMARGNTKNIDVQASLESGYRAGRWLHNILLDWYVARESILIERNDGTLFDNDKTTANRQLWRYKPEFYFTSEFYGFVLFQGERDTPLDIDGRYSQVLGVGYKLIDTELITVDAEVGAGNKRTLFISDSPTLRQPIAYFGLTYEHEIGDLWTLEAEASADTGDENTSTEGTFSAIYQLTDAVSLKATVEARHNSRLRGQRGEKLDTIFGFRIINEF